MGSRSARIGTDRRGRDLYFVHLPRTGGTSVREWLGLPGGANHHPARLIREKHPGCRVVGVLRDPFERVVSEYRYQHRFERPVLRLHEHFAWWLETPRGLDYLAHPQWAAASMLDGAEWVRFCGLEAYLRAFLKEAGIRAPRAPMPRENETGRLAPLSAYYAKPWTRDAVERLCAWDIAQLGQEDRWDSRGVYDARG